MQTIAELKQEALDCEAARAAEIKADADTKVKSIELLKANLPTVTPLGAYPFDLSSWGNEKTAVTFHIPGHADITAVFDYNRYDNTWTQRRIDSDTRAMWRVRPFDRIEWDGSDESYVPIYLRSDFGDLGEALLSAERSFVDPAQIKKQLDEANAMKAFTSPVVSDPPAPEPTAADILLDALKHYIDERLDAKAYAVGFE